MKASTRRTPAAGERIAKLEATLPTLATKADLEAARGDLKGWMLATVLVLVFANVGAMFTIATFMKPVVAVQSTTAAP